MNGANHAAAAAGALAHLAVEAGLWHEDEHELAARLSSALEEQGELALPLADRLALAAAAVGLRARAMELDDEAALARVSGGSPVLASDAAEERWFGLLCRTSGVVTWVDADSGARPVDAGEMRDSLGAVPGRRRWVVLVPRLEADPSSASATRSGHGMPPLLRLAKLLRPDAGDLLAVVLFAVTTGTLMLATPIAVQALVNFVAMGGALPPLIVVATMLFLVLVLAGVLSAVQTWVVEVLQRRLFVRLVADLGARLPRLDPRIHDTRFGPELVNRFFDVVTIQKTGAGLLLDGISILLSVSVGLVVLAFYHPLLLAYDVLLLASIALIVLGPIRSGTRTAIAESKAKYAVAAWFDEVARQPLLFRSAGLESWVFRRTDEAARTYVEKRVAHFRVLFGQIIAGVMLHAVASTLLLSIGGLLVIKGSLTLGQLVAAELIVTMIVGSVAKMGKHIEGFYDLMASTDKVGELLDLPVEVDEEPPLARSLPVGPCALEVRGLSGGRAGGGARFAGISVALRPGERLGVSGPSGAGKRELLELLWGVRRPEHGTVLLDGRSLRDLSPTELRRSAALIADAEVLVDSVRENVRLGRLAVSEDDVREALRRVGLLEVLELLPDGLETRLSPRGWPLSDGEVRCLQVARALVDPPRLLLVSDVFPELSGELRRRLVDVLCAPDAPWTLVVATNAEDLLERCDRVLELSSGQLRAGTAAAPSDPNA
jgi:putative ABC transport system ATP-binding protein